MANEVRVTTESVQMITDAARRSLIETSSGKRCIAHFYTVGPELMMGSMAEYEMLVQALQWGQRKADARTFFYPSTYVYYRYVDAAGAFADIEEAHADTRVYFYSTYSNRLADAALGFAYAMYEKNADARAFFAVIGDRKYIDATVGFAYSYERRADARAFFANQYERTADARTYFVHLSDLYNLQEFLSMYIPQLWYTPEWGAVAITIEPGDSKVVILPKDSTFHKAVILFGAEIKVRIMAMIGGIWNFVADINETTQGWARAELPQATEKVLIINTGARRISAYIVYLRK